MKFELSKKTQSLLDQVTEFINKEIIPNESLYEQQVEEGGRWCVPPIIEEMKEKAKKAGLWNLFLPESELGAGLTNFEYAHLAEQMGRSGIASEVFNSSACRWQSEIYCWIEAMTRTPSSSRDSCAPRLSSAEMRSSSALSSSIFALDASTFTCVSEISLFKRDFSCCSDLRN